MHVHVKVGQKFYDKGHDVQDVQSGRVRSDINEVCMRRHFLTKIQKLAQCIAHSHIVKLCAPRSGPCDADNIFYGDS